MTVVERKQEYPFPRNLKSFADIETYLKSLHRALAGGQSALAETVASASHTHATVVFPATQVSSADVNILDDYEEGTWTPVYSGTTGTIGATAYSTQEGTYTKIGRLVTARATIILTDNGDWTGSVKISGLPFAAVSYSWGAIMVSNITYDGQLTITAEPTQTYCMVYVSKTGTALSGLACSGVPNTGRFYFTITYEAAT